MTRLLDDIRQGDYGKAVEDGVFRDFGIFAASHPLITAARLK
jgi:hypothetical protein